MARKISHLIMAAVLPIRGDAPIVLAVNEYDALGRLATAKLPGETVSYAYNVRNALTAITSPRFSQQLRYAAGAANPCCNGNITETVTQGNKYAYTYDNANRLTAAKYTPSAGNSDYSATYSYDRNSNITALTRKGQTGRFLTFGTVDDLTMTYDGNRLSKVEDAADEVLLENSYDINPGIGDFIGLPQFSYDANGNTTRDISRNLYGVTYNALNLPQSATISSESSKLVMPSDASRIDYTYDGTGVKHQTVHTTVTKTTLGNKVLTRTKRDTTRYVGSRIYENGQLDRVLTPYGYIRDGVHHTFLRDYQGNVAAVIAGDSLVQRTSYYPYGLPHANAHGATANPYKYGGKEFDTFGGTDLYDFHARHHAPSTGRFMTVDPMAEKYPGLSPYMYCAGNPIFYTDPTGMDVVADDKMQEAIRNTLNKMENDYVEFDENGLLNNDLLSQMTPMSDNFASLQTVSNSELTYFCEAASAASDGTAFSYDAETDQGRTGVTEMPGNAENPSPDGNVHIKVYEGLNPLHMATSISHELYGHGYIYEVTRDAGTASHKYDKITDVISYDEEFGVPCITRTKEDTNTFLQLRIENAKNQTIKNYENWYR